MRYAVLRRSLTYGHLRRRVVLEIDSHFSPLMRLRWETSSTILPLDEDLDI